LDVTFLVSLATIGILAFAGGYAIGLRLTVRALIVWSSIAGAAVLAASLILGVGALGSILKTFVALALLQVGYFIAAVSKPEPAEQEAGARPDVKRVRS
jgi:hypothetical protein